MNKIDVTKCEDTLDKLQKILNETKLNLSELIWTYGQLGFNIGGSLEGQSYDVEEVMKQYYTSPRLSVALMAQGLHIQTWVNDIEEHKDDDKSN
jgi:hypothetical protein